MRLGHEGAIAVAAIALLYVQCRVVEMQGQHDLILFDVQLGAVCVDLGFQRGSRCEKVLVRGDLRLCLVARLGAAIYAEIGGVVLVDELLLVVGVPHRADDGLRDLVDRYGSPYDYLIAGLLRARTFGGGLIFALCHDLLRCGLFLNIPTVDVAAVAYGLEFRRPCIVIRTCHRIVI